MFRPKTKLTDSACDTFKSFVQNKKIGKGKKTQVLDFNKIEYYKEVFTPDDIEYHITFLITHLVG